MLGALLGNLNQLNAGGGPPVEVDLSQQFAEDEEILKVILKFIEVRDHGHIDG